MSDSGDLPERFTVDDVRRMPIRQIEDLEKREDLTPEQRESFDLAWAEVEAEMGAKVSGLVTPELPKFQPRDKLSKRLLESTNRTRDIVEGLRVVTPPRPDFSSLFEAQEKQASVRREAERMRESREEWRWKRQHELIEAVAESTAVLAERTEQQYREAQRQRTVTWLLTFMVIGATVAPVIQGNLKQGLLTVAITSALVGIAWLLSTRAGGRDSA